MRPSPFLLAGSILLAGGCASMKVRSELAPHAELGRYRTFSWSAPRGAVEQPQSILDQDIKAALKQQLGRKGLVEATTSPADFVIGFHVLREHKVAVTDWGNGIYGWAPEVTSYTEGTLIVDFIDPRSNRVFWRGSATGAIEHPGVVNLKRLERATAEIVDRYPLRMAAAAKPTM